MSTTTLTQEEDLDAMPPPEMPSARRTTPAVWQHRTLRSDEMPNLNELVRDHARDQSAALPGVAVKLERTPPEFNSLYAALERQISLSEGWEGIGVQRMGMNRSYVLGVTSAIGGEGKTTTALHLALTVARNTLKRVCLLDLSLGRDEMGARLGIKTAGRGLVGVLEDAETVVPTLQLAECENLVVIPAGIAPDNAARLARSPRITELIESARATFDLVIVDLPAVSTDNVLPLARYTDGLLMVTRAGVTPRHLVTQAVETLGRDRVIGVTLNRSQSSCPAWVRQRFGQR